MNAKNRKQESLEKNIRRALAAAHTKALADFDPEAHWQKVQGKIRQSGSSPAREVPLRSALLEIFSTKVLRRLAAAAQPASPVLTWGVSLALVILLTAGIILIPPSFRDSGTKLSHSPVPSPKSGKKITQSAQTTTEIKIIQESIGDQNQDNKSGPDGQTGGVIHYAYDQAVAQLLKPVPVSGKSADGGNYAMRELWKHTPGLVEFAANIALYKSSLKRAKNLPVDLYNRIQNLIFQAENEDLPAAVNSAAAALEKIRMVHSYFPE